MLIFRPNRIPNTRVTPALKKIVVFASGSGTNFQALIDEAQSGRIEARIAGLITDRGEIGAIRRAENHGIPVRVLSPGELEKNSRFAEALLKVLRGWDPDLIVLAGYLRKIPPAVISAYRGSIINIHPALLPDYGGEGFHGMNVHRAVIENRETRSGCSVHHVTEQYDEGEVIDREAVPVRPGDTPESLAERVLEKEHELLPRVVARLLEEQNSNS